jgi:SAM-dependent methyltransferase
LLEPRQRFQWYARNIGLYLADEVAIDRVWNFRCKDIAYPGPFCKPRKTPSRVLSNLFWLNLPASAIRDELGPIRLLDIGCGRGRYFPLLDRQLGGVQSYTGTDVYRSPDFDKIERDPRARFALSGAEELDPALIAETNLIFSQSSFEHVQFDLLSFRRIADAAKAKSSPTLQMHLLPSALMFRQYGPHGYRGYNSQCLKAIADLFADFSEVTVYTLGGSHCVEVHCDYIFDCFDTAKRDRRKWRTSRYVAALQAALSADMAEPHIPVNEACGVALVIHSRPMSGIFGRDTFLAGATAVS